ncbi:alpha-soluble NSF attachment protein [Angomonas deanei]|nr:alpha-soluble NSF attachment protein [Angomonas deanei]|eukprot:EPY34005.1 alpha-soluble NSF attachment protein [Angomonas deanei]
MLETEEAGRLAAKAGDVAGAVSLMSKAVDLYDKKQKYQNAGKVCAELGDLTEGKEAMKWLDQAVRYYKAQGSKVTAQEIVNKMADVKARGGDYQGASEMYEKLGREALEDPLARGGARKLFFNALLAQFAAMTPDNVMEGAGALEERFNEFQELDVQFNVHTREHMLITAMIDAVLNEDIDGLEAAVADFDNIVPLDATRQKMILRAKAALRGRVNDLR